MFVSGRSARLAAFVGVALVASLANAGAQTTPVPANVRIPVELTTQLTSGTAHVGDAFAFRTRADVKLGDAVLPAGSLGHGRIAVVTAAHDRVRGTISVQADAIDRPNGEAISVNVDTAAPLRGRLANRRTRISVLPVLIGIVPYAKTTVDGDLILDVGTPFAVITTLPRASLAPLMTAAPSAVPMATISPRS